MLPIENQRFKQVREVLNFTQQEFGEKLGLNSQITDIERGKTKLSGKIVMLLMRDYQINPLWLFGESPKMKIESTITTMPKTIVINPDGNENILMVNAKAAAGYAQNIGDIEYIEQIPSFSIPLPEYRQATFRGFQIVGDSMQPLVQPQDWVLAKAVESWKDIRNGHLYVVVEMDTIRFKK